MNIFLFAILIIAAAGFFVLFLRGKYKTAPLWLMLSAWAVALGAPQLNLSDIERPWSGEFWVLVIISLASFTAGFFAFNKFWSKYPIWERLSVLKRDAFSPRAVRIAVYSLAALSAVGLFLFYQRAGNFPLTSADPDVFRFQADEQVPGLINYVAQLARLFIPLAFFLVFWQSFDWRKHWDLILLCLLGTVSLVLFASRTQIFFIDLWVMALYLFIRRPNWIQALRFYPIFLVMSVAVLAAVPLIRQAKSYGNTYLADVTVINTSGFLPGGEYLLPIYVGISFNMQALLHAQQYYETHDIQMGRVTLDPFTNIVGLDNLGSNFDLCDIFQCWWNTGTYLFPFVQDFGNAAFYFVPFLIAGILVLLWRYWQARPNFLSVNLYAYACFFIVMTIYLSFTVRAEMYIDLFVLFVTYLAVTHNWGISDAAAEKAKI
jgi:oligosaccharide repeat unit polymerase